MTDCKEYALGAHLIHIVLYLSCMAFVITLSAFVGLYLFSVNGNQFYESFIVACMLAVSLSTIVNEFDRAHWEGV